MKIGFIFHDFHFIIVYLVSNVYLIQLIVCDSTKNVNKTLPKNNLTIQQSSGSGLSTPFENHYEIMANGTKSKNQNQIPKNTIKKVRKNKTSLAQSLKLNKPKKKGKVFADSKEDTLHLKLIDNMMFKPLESNNSVSIDFSESSNSEITQDDIDQAIEGREGSYIAIPMKRKKDVYQEFLRWAHNKEKNEKLAKIEKEVIGKHKAKVRSQLLAMNSKNSTAHKIRYFKGNFSQNIKHEKVVQNVQKNVNKSVYKSIGPPPSSVKGKSSKTSKCTNKTPSINSSTIVKKESFIAETVEFQFDPDFVHKVYNSGKQKSKKEKKKKVKKRPDDVEFRVDIGASDYSAHENFMLNTQKEAMGRRFYQMFINKTAADFWDNSTLETTKMLEVLLPLGKHLHETLDKVPPNEGRHFMEDLQLYKRELQKFITLVKQNKADTRPDVVDLLEEPNEHVCETQYGEEEVKIMFGWDDNQFAEFEKVLEETREMWFDLQLFHHCYQFVSDSAESISASYNCSMVNLGNITGDFN